MTFKQTTYRDCLEVRIMSASQVHVMLKWSKTNKCSRL